MNYNKLEGTRFLTLTNETIMLINTSGNPVTTTATVLASIGAINWGLIGLFNFNLVTYLFGEATTLTKLTYIAVGGSGIYLLLTLARIINSPAVGDIK